MLSSDLLPDRAGDSSTQGLPERTVMGIGAITAAFATYGSLNAITSFASLAFIVVFGGICVLTFRERNRAEAHPAILLIGPLGSVAFSVLMFWHLYWAEPETFYAVWVIAGGVVGGELLYFERTAPKEESEEAGTWMEEGRALEQE
jgi:amino acid transporter